MIELASHECKTAIWKDAHEHEGNKAYLSSGANDKCRGVLFYEEPHSTLVATIYLISHKTVFMASFFK